MVLSSVTTTLTTLTKWIFSAENGTMSSNALKAASNNKHTHWCIWGILDPSLGKMVTFAFPDCGSQNPYAVHAYTAWAILGVVTHKVDFPNSSH